MFTTRTFDLTDDADLVIHEFDRPAGAALDLELMAFTVHCGGPVIIGATATAAAA